MWDLPGPGLEPMSPALAGRFSTTAPPGKSLQNSVIGKNFSSLEDCKRHLEQSFAQKDEKFWETSLVAQWLRICLPMQGTRVRFLVQEDLTCCRAKCRLSSWWRMGLVALRHVRSSRTRDRTFVPCIGRRILNHCATREVPNTCFPFF
ncbi:hypothetical protein J1605_003308 [Eschrichtius robustus]|uniref:Uncharacterized protein n=1 Tax=Eschrichtius robustus TaxID=9764 RepID=A0AB34HMS8_ESCRO|nr:hypothetical protein J1605_003308 [Eschrichtius robustus]